MSNFDEKDVNNQEVFEETPGGDVENYSDQENNYPDIEEAQEAQEVPFEETPGGDEQNNNDQANDYPSLEEIENASNLNRNSENSVPEDVTPGNDEQIKGEQENNYPDYEDFLNGNFLNNNNPAPQNQTPSGDEVQIEGKPSISEQFEEVEEALKVEPKVQEQPKAQAQEQPQPKPPVEDDFVQIENDEPKAQPQPKPPVEDDFVQIENDEPQAQEEKKPSIVDQFEQIEIDVEKVVNENKGGMEDVQFDIPAKLAHLKPILGTVKAEDILGASPDLTGSNPNASYTAEQGKVMLDAVPAVALEQHANRLKNIQLAYAKDVNANGFDPKKDQQAKTEMLQQIAEMRKLTSQGMMVAEDGELFSMGDKNGINIFAGGQEKIIGAKGVVSAMDAKLESVDAAIRRGWPMSDLNAIGNLGFLAKSIEGLQKERYIASRDKEKIKEFVEFVDDLKYNFKTVREEERFEKIEEAMDMLDKLPVEAKIDEFEDMYQEAKQSLKDAYKHEPKKNEIGRTQAGWDKIKAQSFTKNDLDNLKKNVKEQMEIASSTLQAKCMSEKGANEKSLSKNDAIKAYATMFEKNSSMLHKDSPQFKQIKDGIKKVTGGKGSEADRQKLLEDVKSWLTDPKYDRIKKHSGSSFDNKRFNEVFALANELDPKWAKEQFSSMKLFAHHGDKSSQFKNINEFLNFEHKAMIDNKCIENSAAQKNKAWYTGKAPKMEAGANNGKVKNVKLSELENANGMGKKQGQAGKRSSQNKAAKKGPSHIM